MQCTRRTFHICLTRSLWEWKWMSRLSADPMLMSWKKKTTHTVKDVQVFFSVWAVENGSGKSRQVVIWVKLMSWKKKKTTYCSQCPGFFSFWAVENGSWKVQTQVLIWVMLSWKTKKPHYCSQCPCFSSSVLAHWKWKWKVRTTRVDLGVDDLKEKNTPRILFTMSRFFVFSFRSLKMEVESPDY